MKTSIRLWLTAALLALIFALGLFAAALTALATLSLILSVRYLDIRSYLRGL